MLSEESELSTFSYTQVVVLRFLSALIPNNPWPRCVCLDCGPRASRGLTGHLQVTENFVTPIVRRTCNESRLGYTRHGPWSITLGFKKAWWIDNITKEKRRKLQFSFVLNRCTTCHSAAWCLLFPFHKCQWLWWSTCFSWCTIVWWCMMSCDVPRKVTVMEGRRSMFLMSGILGVRLQRPKMAYCNFIYVYIKYALYVHTPVSIVIIPNALNVMKRLRIR